MNGFENGNMGVKYTKEMAIRAAIEESVGFNKGDRIDAVMDQQVESIWLVVDFTTGNAAVFYLADGDFETVCDEYMGDRQWDKVLSEYRRHGGNNE